MNQEAIVKQLEIAWEQNENILRKKKNNNQASIRFPSTGRSQAQFANLEGWNQTKYAKNNEKNQKQMNHSSFNFLPTKVKFNLPVSITQREKNKTQLFSPSIIMMGSPISGSKPRYFLREKDSFKIGKVQRIRKRGARLYVKSCEDKSAKNNESSDNTLVNKIKYKTKGTSNMQFRTTKNAYYKNTKSNKGQVLKII